jgi:ribosomal-protein-alanine N-acetyltransferase
VTISAPRLDLVPMSAAFIDALLEDRRDEAAELLGAAMPDDWPDEHDERVRRYRREQMRRDPETARWLVRAIVLPEPARPMIGHAGFHGAPGANGPRKPGALEIGYTVFPPHRGRGFATEAAVALMDWARTDRGIHHFIASVSPTNEPSLAIVRKLGFVQTGDQWDDEDGLELVFELID